MILLADPTEERRGAERRSSDMNPYATLVAQTQLQELRAASARNRLARTTRSARPSRLARARATVKAAFTTPTESPSFLPHLTDYPYRG
jgi:hypothetical protein